MESIYCCCGESARRSEYIPLQQLAESQVWISGAEKICLKGCLLLRLRATHTFYLGAPTVVLCGEDPHVIPHVFPDQHPNSFLSGHTSSRPGELYLSCTYNALFFRWHWLARSCCSLASLPLNFTPLLHNISGFEIPFLLNRATQINRPCLCNVNVCVCFFLFCPALFLL